MGGIKGNSLATEFVSSAIAYDWRVNGKKSCDDVKKELSRYCFNDGNIVILDEKVYTKSGGE